MTTKTIATHTPTLEANRRLIAAAPRMKDALESLLWTMDELALTAAPVGRLAAEYTERVTRARALLREIEGA